MDPARRRFRFTAPVVALAALASAVAATACGGEGEATNSAPAPDYDRALADAPPQLAALHARAGERVEGGPEAFRRQLSELEGFPVVVNKWASWCGPCRTELPFFQSQSARRGTEVAFLGVNSADGPETARGFIEEFPVPYPHFADPDEEVAEEFEGGAGFPVTAFFDSRGELAHVKRGPYASESELAHDIRTHAR